MAGWMVMAAPLELVVRVLAPLSCLVGLRWLWRQARDGRGRGDGVADEEILETYLLVVGLGWPADARGTIAEVAVRLGSTVPEVRSVLERDGAIRPV